MKDMRDGYAKVGGQRYVLVFFVSVLTSFLLWQGKLTSADYALIMCTNITAYIAGRAYQKTKAGVLD